MKKFLSQLQSFITQRHRATVITFLIALVIIVPLQLRQSKLKEDFARAARYERIAELYKNLGEKSKALQAIDEAITLYRPVLAKQDSALAYAMKMRNEISRLPEGGKK